MIKNYLIHRESQQGLQAHKLLTGPSSGENTARKS